MRSAPNSCLALFDEMTDEIAVARGADFAASRLRDGWLPPQAVKPTNAVIKNAVRIILLVLRWDVPNVAEKAPARKG